MGIDKKEKGGGIRSNMSMRGEKTDPFCNMSQGRLNMVLKAGSEEIVKKANEKLDIGMHLMSKLDEVSMAKDVENVTIGVYFNNEPKKDTKMWTAGIRFRGDNVNSWLAKEVMDNLAGHLQSYFHDKLEKLGVKDGRLRPDEWWRPVISRSMETEYSNKALAMARYQQLTVSFTIQSPDQENKQEVVQALNGVEAEALFEIPMREFFAKYATNVEVAKGAHEQVWIVKRSTAS
jgi:hypothetical protein